MADARYPRDAPDRRKALLQCLISSLLSFGFVRCLGGGVARYRLDICVACIACRNEHHVFWCSATDRWRLSLFFMAARHDFAFLGVEMA